MQSNSYLGDDKYNRKATSNSSAGTPGKSSVVERAKQALANPAAAKKARIEEEARAAAATAAMKASFNPDPTPTPGKLKELRGLYEKGSDAKAKFAQATASAGIMGWLNSTSRSPSSSPAQKPSKMLAPRSGAVAENVTFITEGAGSDADPKRPVQQLKKSAYADFIQSGRQPSNSGYTPPPIPASSPPAYAMKSPNSYLPPAPPSPTRGGFVGRGTAGAAGPAGTSNVAKLASKFNSTDKSVADDIEDGTVNPITVLITVFVYAVALLAAWRYEDVYRVMKSGGVGLPSIASLGWFKQSGVSLLSPYVDHGNASWVIKHRLGLIEADFEEVLQSKEWSSLWSGSNVTVEALDKGDGSWPIYVRSFAVFDCKPEVLYNLLNWDHFDSTQRKVDPFHESVRLLSNPSTTIKIVRKTTKRPFVMPKREFALALVEKTHRSHFTIQNVNIRSHPMKPITTVTVERGILVNAIVNVNVIDKVLYPNGKQSSDSGYVRAYQDMMGYLIPLESGGTLLLSMMRVDLGPDIPRFAFKTTLGATVAWAMGALRKLADT